MSPGAPSGRLGRRSFVGAALAAFVGCDSKKPDVSVDLSNRRAGRPAPDGGSLRFAIGTMLTPRETAKAYLRLAEYLHERTGHPVEILQRSSYAETNALLEGGSADLAFVCTGAYLSLKPGRFEVIAVPMVNGKLTYASLILVKRDDPASTLAHLLGSSFAFVDPLSLTGRIYPEWAARQAAADAGAPFSSVVYTHSHSNSIDRVALGRVRAAGVDSLVYEHLLNTQPARVAELRVLQRSKEFGNPPIVAGPGLSNGARHALRDALLQAHLHTEGRAILLLLGFDRFAPQEPGAYDGIEHMQKSIVRRDLEQAPP